MRGGDLTVVSAKNGLGNKELLITISQEKKPNKTTNPHNPHKNTFRKKE